MLVPMLYASCLPAPCLGHFLYLIFPIIFAERKKRAKIKEKCEKIRQGAGYEEYNRCIWRKYQSMSLCLPIFSGIFSWGFYAPFPSISPKDRSKKPLTKTRSLMAGYNGFIVVADLWTASWRYFPHNRISLNGF